ncbi:hypothetical protein Q3G72_024679 [Acer saccharum]|nr:hypothetical protein Q3G72_024679 [Acer saccharum]
MKVGEKPAEQSTFEKSGASKEKVMEMDGSKENGDNVFDMDTDVHVQTVFEGEMEKNNVSTAVHLEKVEGGNNEFSDKVEGDNEISEKADGDTEIVHAEVGNTSVSAGLSKDPEYKNILDEDEIEIINSACLANDMLSNDVEKADPQKLDLEKLVKQPLLVDEYPSRQQTLWFQTPI